jgi:hypothetical protein
MTSKMWQHYHLLLHRTTKTAAQMAAPVPEIMDIGGTYSHETDKLFIADCLVRFIDRRRALWSMSITEACISTSIVITTLVSKLQLTH